MKGRNVQERKRTERREVIWRKKRVSNDEDLKYVIKGKGKEMVNGREGGRIA